MTLKVGNKDVKGLYYCGDDVHVISPQTIAYMPFTEELGLKSVGGHGTVDFGNTYVDIVEPGQNTYGCHTGDGCHIEITNANFGEIHFSTWIYIYDNSLLFRIVSSSNLDVYCSRTTFRMKYGTVFDASYTIDGLVEGWNFVGFTIRVVGPQIWNDFVVNGKEGSYYRTGTPISISNIIIGGANSATFADTIIENRSLGQYDMRWRYEATKGKYGKGEKADITIGPGIYHNKFAGLLSMSGDGENWFTIADRNLGAVQTIQDTATLTSWYAGGYMYQWGNNFGFIPGLMSSYEKTSVKISIAGKSWQNPVNYNKFITNTTNSSCWWSEGLGQHGDLWGGITGTNEAMRGPCGEGWHIMSYWDVAAIYGIYLKINNVTTANRTDIRPNILGAKPGYIWYNGTWYTSTNQNNWLSNWQGPSVYGGGAMNEGNQGTYYNNYSYLVNALPIRPVRNENVKPGTKRDKIL